MSTTIKEITKQIQKAKQIVKGLAKNEAIPVYEGAVIWAYKDENGDCWWCDAIGYSRIYDGTVELLNDGVLFNKKKINL